MWLVCCMYPSFDVDGHEEPAQKDDNYQRLKQTTNNQHLLITFPPVFLYYLQTYRLVRRRYYLCHRLQIHLYKER